MPPKSPCPNSKPNRPAPRKPAASPPNKPPPPKKIDYLMVYGHSNLFYWWPVWLVSFVLAGVTGGQLMPRSAG